jgi:bifunctional ADP-heptose synthase (sugar kinase/adenylyltransferase)
MDTAQQKQFNVLLIGDSCLDKYIYTSVDRISPEAPVPVCSISKEVQQPGMAANVKENLEALNCKVSFLSGVLSSKTRIIDSRSNQHMLRIDNDIFSEPLDTNFIDFSSFDAVVISDYNKGLLTYENIQNIIKESTVPVFIDTKKKDLSKFKGSYVKINQLEFESATSYTDDLIITKGSDSVVYKNNEYNVPDINILDVCGAGDTFLSSLTYKYLESGSIDVAIKFAICSSGKTVQKMGVYAPKLEEIE